MRRLPLLGVTSALAACTVTPSVILQFPDAKAELEAAELTVHALPRSADCAALMGGTVPESPLATVTAKLPLDGSAHLGRLPRGPTIFFAELRDQNARPFLRGCQPASSGGEVIIDLLRLNRPPAFTAPTGDLRVREGDALDVTVTAIDPDGTAVRLSTVGLPSFATFDAATGLLRLRPGPADQGPHDFTLEATEDVTGGAVTTRMQPLTVDDFPRPLKWDRLYRGWHGRFDAAAMWDPVYNALVTSGGRDTGVDLSVKTLYTGSNAPDVLNDYRILSFSRPTPDWSYARVDRAGVGGKYGHAMGWVRTIPSGFRYGFSIGGIDGVQISAESLLLEPSPVFVRVSPPAALLNPNGTIFYSHMTSAIDADESSTYLFGGDLGMNLYSNELRQVTATDSSGQVTLIATRLLTSLIPRPAARSQAAMVVAQNPKRIVLIGGRNTELGGSPVFDDAWVLCLEEAGLKCPAGSRLQWMKVFNTGDTFPGSGAPGVFALVAGYDAPRDRVITYGGLGVVSDQSWLFEDVFELDLSAAVPQADGGISAPFRHLPAPGGPLGIVGGAAAQDTDAGRLLIYGGVTGRVLNGAAQLDLLEDHPWVLGLTPGNERLTRLTTVGGPPAPTRRVAAHLTTRGRFQFLGGESEGGHPLDEWRLDGDGGVVAVTNPGDTPWPRANMATVYNPDLDEHWFYGGRVGNLLPTSALYRLGDAGFVRHEHLMSPASPEDPRFGAGAAYDTRNHRMVLFGGIGITAGGTSGSLNDVFTLTMQGAELVSTKISPDGDKPTPRYGTVAGYDAVGQRMFLFGGTAAVVVSEVDTNELWELSLVPGQERWRLVETMGAKPEPMYLPVGVLTKEQPPNFYIVGTVARPGGMRPFVVDELWRIKLDGSPNPTWVKMTRPDFRPRPRVFPGVIYDELQNRLLLAGGASDPVFRNDIWSLTLP